MRRFQKFSRPVLFRLYWEQGQTQDQIARAFHVAQSTVGRAMKALGIERRDGGRSGTACCVECGVVAVRMGLCRAHYRARERQLYRARGGKRKAK